MTLGTLFTEDFLAEGIETSPVWADIDDDALLGTRDALLKIVAAVNTPARLNESQTEERIVRPMLHALGWTGCFSVQTNLEAKRRANVADYSLFADPDAFAQADALGDHDQKLRHVVAVGDAKAWSIGLDQRGGGAGQGETPSAQIIRYLTRAHDRGRVRFGILTNGRQWRLYFAGARSILEGYYEADLAAILGLPGAGTIGAEAARLRRLKLFLLIFRRAALAPQARLGHKHFLDYAIDQGRLWETKVRTDLSQVVFEEVFPGLIRALAAADPAPPAALTPDYLGLLREAALTALYRLLFSLYAEDRDLISPHDKKFDDYSLSRLRDGIAERLDGGDAIGSRSTHYWDHCLHLFHIIDEGDKDLCIPPYNGGLFARARAPLLERARIADKAFAPLLDRLSRTTKDGRLVRINFRDLSVRELGAIYEGLLDYEPVADQSAEGGIAIRPNAFSRKNTGSYYTPDDLVDLIIERTVKPLVEEKIERFVAEGERLAADRRPLPQRLAELERLDPATAILDLKVCDPAMGSGHFLVSLIDYLAGQVFTVTGEASARVAWLKEHYVSPLLARIAAIRGRIEAEAAANAWTIRPESLNDQNLIKRMVLKRCVYGVDKNPMAVELAKVALWLHTFTTGAPLSFLDHHLRCGDSLFGETVRRALDELHRRANLFANEAVRRAEGAIAGMQVIENLTDAEIAEVKASSEAFAEVEGATRTLKGFLDFWQAIKWLTLSKEEETALSALLDGAFGDALEVAAGLRPPAPPASVASGAPSLFGEEPPEQLTLAPASSASAQIHHALRGLLVRAHALAKEERFLHWQVAFPGVWRNWQNAAPDGGFDAVIGNPPWDRMKMQEVEWFAAREPSIARKARAADRKSAIAALKQAGDPLVAAYELASGRAEQAMERARKSGNYPLLSKGDINLYALFVERAQGLIKPSGIAGLVVPSGIASDLTASAFFKTIASSGRLLCLFDFENKGIFFPDVHRSFKFCTFVVAGAKHSASVAECAFFLDRPPSRANPDQLFTMTAADFALVNPNTGTAPIFRTQRDAALTTAIYRRLPVLVDRSTGVERKAWPVKYMTMFHMTNDSHLFWTRERLEAEGAYPVGLGRWKKGEQEWVPLYVGRMIHQFDHRAASVTVNEDNLHNAALSETTTHMDRADPKFTPQSQFYIRISDIKRSEKFGIGFRDIARSTDERTCIGAIVPSLACGNTLPLILGFQDSDLIFFVSNFNSFFFDYIARQKNQSTHLNWYIVEQLPVVPPEAYSRAFGPKSAAEIVKDHVLRLTYTAWDMQPFARDMGYQGEPFLWDETERRHLRARLDALYFHLYGVTDESDIRYILGTFPIVERKDRERFEGVFLTAELIIWYLRALAAGDPDALAPEKDIIRQAKRCAA